MPRPIIEKDLQWFLSRGVRTASGCLLWTGKKDRSGYGISSTGAREYRVHRKVFALRFGEEPEAVMHICDTPPCFEPTHLIGGTRAENNLDKAAKGRARSRAKLTFEQAMEIRRRRLAGEEGKSLALEYGVTQATVCDISKGRSWTNYVPIEPRPHDRK
ncbi:HNH endonuclease [Streptomyces cinereoruber]|uniref:HNH endonuclease n=1 Tax=Streptomyces cinereoruber TaxID=67260 RepID=UPI003668656B